MPESLDIIAYLLEKSDFKLDPRKLPKEICSALGAVKSVRSKLFKSRFLSLNLEELASDSAREYFQTRWNMTNEKIEYELGQTDIYLQQLQPQLQRISDALESEAFCLRQISNGRY